MHFQHLKIAIRLTFKKPCINRALRHILPMIKNYINMFYIHLKIFNSKTKLLL